jgi:hypothetical protein
MKLVILSLGAFSLSHGHLNAGLPGTRNLLDGQLSAWEVFTGVPHRSVQLPGFPASESEDGKTGKPVGLADPLKIFTVEIQDGKPILRISGQIYAGLTSKEEFENYHFTCQFKWGEKKWEPRLNSKRDSGVLYHCNGSHGAFWNVWMRSPECQVQEGDCGDFISLAGATASVQLRRVPEGKNPSFDPNAPLFSRGFGVVAHGPSEEKPHGEWNTLEIYTLGATSCACRQWHS